MRARSLKAIAGLSMLLAIARVGVAFATPAGEAAAVNSAAASGTADRLAGTASIVNNVVGRPSVRTARGPRGADGPAGPPGLPGSTGTIQVVTACASCAAGDGRGPANASLGAIAGALIAGLFGLLGLVIAKENKTSEFRQSWIDALRNDIADFASSAQSFVYYEGARRDEKDPMRELEYEKILKDVHQKLVQAQMSIRLRVNPHESEGPMKGLNDSLLKCIERIRVHLNKPDFAAANNELVQLHEVATPILKTEWGRVKRGERPYVIAKYCAYVLIVVTLATLVYVAVHGV